MMVESYLPRQMNLKSLITEAQETGKLKGQEGGEQEEEDGA